MKFLNYLKMYNLIHKAALLKNFSTLTVTPYTNFGARKIS